MSVSMPFGKYRRQPVKDLPSAYLRWLASLEDLRPWLKQAVDAELQARGFDQTRDREPIVSLSTTIPTEHREPLASMIESGFRALAHRSHPDVGGTNDAMRRLIETRAWARRELLQTE